MKRRVWIRDFDGEADRRFELLAGEGNPDEDIDFSWRKFEVVEPSCTCSPGVESIECPWHGGTI